MPRNSLQLRADALAIWQAAVDAVRSDRLVVENLRVDGNWLLVGDDALDLAAIGRIAVVGAGKAGAGMAAGIESALGPRLLSEKQVTGWVNVPADCVRPLSHIHLHAARPAGVNEPTADGILGAERILEMVSRLGPRDLCLCLISGGGSALLPAPVSGVSLEDKQSLTRVLSAAGANIQQLNTVRKQLSRIKGGGLARACQAGHLFSLIISDVLGDPLDVIASGPTVPNTASAADALAVLQQLVPDLPQVPTAVIDHLRVAASRSNLARTQPLTAQVTNLVIGNNAVAVDAAGTEAERRGYSHAMVAATSLEGAADDIGIHLARQARHMRDQAGPDCLITGGEPTVRLAPPEQRGKGGRNQQLVLAALVELQQASGRHKPPGTAPTQQQPNPATGLVILSGGTDGEDGPTDAAGAILDEALVAQMHQQGLDPAIYLRRNDAYHFFEPLGGLMKTGPTHTNVCDVRVVVVDRVEGARR